MKPCNRLVYLVITLGFMTRGFDAQSMEKTTAQVFAQAQQTPLHARKVISADKKIELIIGRDNNITVFNSSTREQLLQLQLESALQGAFFNTGSNLLGLQSMDNKLDLWNITTGELFLQLQLEAKFLSSRFSRDNKMLCIISIDNKVGLWNITTGQQLLQLQLESAVQGVAFSHDNKILSVVSSDNKVSVWTIATEEQLLELQLESTNFKVSLNGNHPILRIVCNKGIARYWNIITGQELTVPLRPISPIEQKEEPQDKKRPLEEINLPEHEVEQLKKQRFDT
ncbi:hypothetical protein H0W26_04500 [Candidatus Dependentiae bacterium]|nr:hypothetical protein [Candidatus Dependentiae bacterium]